MISGHAPVQAAFAVCFSSGFSQKIIDYLPRSAGALKRALQRRQVYFWGCKYPEDLEKALLRRKAAA